MKTLLASSCTFALALLGTLALAQAPDTVQLGQNIVYRASGQGLASELRWQIEGGTALTPTLARTDSILVCWDMPGEAWLRLREHSPLGCPGPWAELRVWVVAPSPDDALELLVPNVFTPNGDGINDVFRASANRLPEEFLLLVRDRWGLTVFESRDFVQPWDGTHQGRPCTPGVYFYALQFRDGPQTRVLNGFVQLFE